MKIQLHKLSFVYPPISNRIAEYLKDDKEVQQEIENSNLYLIGQRPEIFFKFNEYLEEDFYTNKTIYGSIFSNNLNSNFEINLAPLLEYKKIKIESVKVSYCDKFMKITDKQDNIIEWFTVEKLLFDRSRKSNLISGIDNYKDFNKFKLLYIGISLKENSLKRLVIKPHDKRLRILSLEAPINKNSELTNEICFFFCKTTNLQINQLNSKVDNIDKFIEDMSKLTGKKENIIADVEKALIKKLNTDYNVVKYKNYPKSKDGLSNLDIDTIIYFLGESYSFKTDTNCIVGNYTEYEFDKQNIADYIITRNGKVELVKMQSK